MNNHHGQWQAQGDDIDARGHCVEWGEIKVPTKEQGRDWLGEVAGKCTRSQRRRREGRACRDARRFIDRAPAEGYPTTSKHFYARDDAYANARIDLEIYGMAFRNGEEPDNNA
ncbi:MAG TPA: hypothetical protein ENJ18_08770 [Nannocystis exedens]|nr:hypothetical protein [Nannocystis exedens]